MLPPPDSYQLMPGPWWLWMAFGLGQLAVLAWGFWRLRRAWKGEHRTEKPE